eukprot:gene15599-15748_t
MALTPSNMLPLGTLAPDFKLLNVVDNREKSLEALSSSTATVVISNDVKNYPDDSPEKMKEIAAEFHYPFPYLYDETQDVAKAYQAACTPDFYVFDGSLKCIYRGQLDDSRPGNDIPVTVIQEGSSSCSGDKSKDFICLNGIDYENT